MNKEIEIPEGYEARIEGNKVILELIDEDAETRRLIRVAINKWFNSDRVVYGEDSVEEEMKNRCLAYLEKQKESTKWRKYSWHPGMRFIYGALVKYDGPYGFEIVPAGNRPSKEVNGMYVFLNDI